MKAPAVTNHTGGSGGLPGASRGAMPKVQWWRSFFDDLFADVWLARRHAGAEVEFLFQQLGLAPGMRVYDQCCGVGRISAGLAAHGVEVVGVDLAESYIARARLAAPSATFVIADAFSHRVQPVCDAAFNWWTSFGYTANDALNQQMLQAAFESLRQGGRFALDYPNVSRLRSQFRPKSEDVLETERGAVRVSRRARLDERRGMLVDVWTYLLPDGEVMSRGGETRLYSADDLETMMNRAGLCVRARFGDVGGSALGPESERCILVAERVG